MDIKKTQKIVVERHDGGADEQENESPQNKCMG